MAHLFGLHPGRQITPRGTPDLAAAAKKSLEMRIANGALDTGWSCAWTINFFARLADGDKAHASIVNLLTRLIAPNLFDRVMVQAGAGFMIDGNLGYTAGVCEMLMQSHNGEIELLPALPKAWPNGAVKGLRARGGFVVDMTWAEGKVVTVTIKSTLGQRCRIRSASPLAMAGRWFRPALKSVDANVVEFNAAAGKSYTLVTLPGKL